MTWTAGPTATTSFGTRSNISITVPAGCSAGQLGIINLYQESNSPGITITPPSGWTALTGGFETNSAPDTRIAPFYKVLVSGDVGAAATFTHSSIYCSAAFASWSTPTASPLDVQGASASAVNNATNVIAAITTTAADDLVTVENNNFGEKQVTGVPSGYSTAVEVAGAASGGNWIGWKEQASAGTTGTASVVLGSSEHQVGIQQAWFQTGGGGGGATTHLLATLGVGV